MTPTSEQEPEPEGQPTRGAGTPPPVDELRLALVCDGGVSLAIYEHGIARELDNVVIASRGFDLVQTSDDPGGPHAELVASLTPVQAAYLDALRHPRDAGALRTVVVDVVAGSSAGGINGVFLAKALSGNHATDALTSLWLDKASILRLLLPSGPARRRGRADAARAPKPAWSPFNGDAMGRWVLEALEAMDATTGLATPGSADPASLLRTGQELDLFVTATDLHGYFRRVPSHDGGKGDVDRQNRTVFHFAPTSRDSGFGPRANGGLAFAARATSCFPGAFAPVSVAHFEEAVRRVPAAVPLVRADFEREHLAQYGLIGADGGTRLFVDGGVLDNRPFDVMIGAIASKSAQTRVDRRIVHIDPDPATWEEPSAPLPTYGSSRRCSRRSA
ncbi:patatin-like phospholipase family protein [Frondihabitans sp. PhB188]|uniref:patatin-like phospholipase family protein n=1 Tax=Frondihabitans sp. PhB188 TaxID=2485200 RepID=UPI0013152401|nr:patatin-like phospholipase family protein [Frondihabitans sp. PhB188]